MENKGSNSQPVTKAYLTQALTRTEGKFAAELAELEERLDEKLTMFRDKILTAVDRVMKEVVAMRQEQALHFHQHERTNERVKDHEGRIKRLEEQKFA